MNEELKKDGWLYPLDPEPTRNEEIEYMHDAVISKGVYLGDGLVDDENYTDMYQEVDLWRKIK